MSHFVHGYDLSRHINTQPRNKLVLPLSPVILTINCPYITTYNRTPKSENNFSIPLRKQHFKETFPITRPKPKPTPRQPVETRDMKENTP